MELEIGKWYKVSDGTSKLYTDQSYWIKYSGIKNDTIRASEYLFNKQFRKDTNNNFGSFGKIGEYNFTLLEDLSEILEYLPLDHPDKIETKVDDLSHLTKLIKNLNIE